MSFGLITIDPVQYLTLILHDWAKQLSHLILFLRLPFLQHFLCVQLFCIFPFNCPLYIHVDIIPQSELTPNETMEAPMRDVDDVRVAPLRECQTRVIDYIEKTFNQILQDIQIRPCGHPSIVLKRIADGKPRNPDDCWDVVDREMKISFPGKTKEEAWRFSQSWSRL